MSILYLKNNARNLWGNACCNLFSEMDLTKSCVHNFQLPSRMQEIIVKVWKAEHISSSFMWVFFKKLSINMMNRLPFCFKPVKMGIWYCYQGNQEKWRKHFHQTDNSLVLLLTCLLQKMGKDNSIIANYSPFAHICPVLTFDHILYLWKLDHDFIELSPTEVRAVFLEQSLPFSYRKVCFPSEESQPQ